MNDKDIRILEKAVQINLDKIDKKYTNWKKNTKLHNTNKELIEIVNPNILYTFPSQFIEIQSSKYQINEDIVPSLIVKELNWEPKNIIEFINITKLVEEKINQLVNKELEFWENIKNVTSLSPEKWITESINEIKTNLSKLQNTKGEIIYKDFYWRGDGKNSILIIVANNSKTSFDLNIEEEKISAAIFTAEAINYSPRKIKLLIETIKNSPKNSQP